MKRLFFLLTLSCALIIASCSKEDSNANPDNTPATILGTWVLDCQQSTNHEEFSAADPDDCWSADYSVFEGGISACSFLFGQDSVSITTTADDGTFTDVYPYTFEGDLLMLGEDEEYTVAKLDRKQLILDGGGTTESSDGTYTYQVHYIFSR